MREYISSERKSQVYDIIKTKLIFPLKEKVKYMILKTKQHENQPSVPQWDRCSFSHFAPSGKKTVKPAYYRTAAIDTTVRPHGSISFDVSSR